MLKKKRNEAPKYIFNPLNEDFSVDYDVPGKGRTTFTIHAREAESFPTYIANHVKKHLANRVLHTRGVRFNVDADLQEIGREIDAEPIND